MRIWTTNRWLKRLAIGATTFVALALIANGFMAWLTDYRLQTRIAAIRAAGDPASIADLAPKPIPDDQNAAFYLERIKPQLDAFSKDYIAFYRSPMGKAYEESDDRPTSEQIAAIDAILKKYPEIGRGVAAAARCDQYAALDDFSVDAAQFVDNAINRQQDVRTVARFSYWRIGVLLNDEKPTEASRLGLELLQIGRLYESEPALFDFLVTISIRGIAIDAIHDALAAGAVSGDFHTDLDQELARQDDPHRVLKALKNERALGFGTIKQFVGDATPAVWARVVGWPVRSYYLGAIDLYGQQLAVASLPWYEVRDQFGPRDKATGAWTSDRVNTGHGPLADLLVPSTRAVYEANARSIMMLRSLRIFNALRQYAELNGHEAHGLENLTLPKEATIDPFSGQPLKLKHTDDGWIIYSVMDNGVDDGGDFKDLKDWGLAPPKLRRWTGSKG